MSNSEQTIKAFVRFLREHSATNRYQYNVTSRVKSKLTAFFRRTNPYNLIDCAFNWYCTNEGYGLWCKLDSEWCKYFTRNGNTFYQ